ncbi:lipocalin family protein [Streptomyces sp. NPDC006422]|uniref:lipocalin family protein n=1 Tax=unclassified Streptomyces TaxID=2593676 RepID=UPI0033BC1D2E
MNAMHLRAELPNATIDLTLDAQGPALYPLGTGWMPFLGGESYYCSLPALKTRGVIALDGRRHDVSGESWLDRQWGDWDWSQAGKWTWMALQLSNGDKINLWDSFESSGQQRHATVLHADGTQEVVEVEPLAPDTTGWWTSPYSNKRYGTKWKVRIPQLDAELNVSADATEQEVQAQGGIYEGASTVSGSLGGKPVSGNAFVEQLGDWR